MDSMDRGRRRFLGLLGAGGAGLLAYGAGLSPLLARTRASVIVVGGGFGGATAAKYLKRFDPSLDVTLIEPARRFHTCPFTNLFLGGLRSFESLGHGYEELTGRYGVRVIHETVDRVDPGRNQLGLSGGDIVDWDRLVLAPGIDIRWNAIEGYDRAAADQVPHAWKAGDQTHLLKRRLEAMEDGGLFILSAPADPFRCPPGPYERASMVAHYFKTHKPRSKILVLDAKDSFSKRPLFEQGWRRHYGDMIEWVGYSGDGKVVRVDPERLEVETEFGAVHRADVINIVPPQQAGAVAFEAGATDVSGWVPVKPATFESAQVPGVYVIGDAAVAAPMPKSGFCANAQAKVTAAAIVADLAGREPPDPVWLNTCYSLVAPQWGISVSGVYRVDEGQIAEVPGSGGISPIDADENFRELEAAYSETWYRAITMDTWGPA